MVLDRILSDSEKKVYQFIKREAEKTLTKIITIPISEISEAVKVSHATTQRAIKKLFQQNIIGIFPSQSKKEANKIVFYGEDMNEDKLIENIIEISQALHTQILMFQNLIEQKELEVKMLKQKIKQLEEDKRKLIESSSNPNESYIVDSNGKVIRGNVLSTFDLDDGQLAVIIQKSEV